MKKGFIRRHLPPIYFTGVNDELEMPNAAIIANGNYLSEKMTSTSLDKTQIEPSSCEFTKSNKDEI